LVLQDKECGMENILFTGSGDHSLWGQRGQQKTKLQEYIRILQGNGDISQETLFKEKCILIELDRLCGDMDKVCHCFGPELIKERKICWHKKAVRIRIV